jgi:hypothetical protein
MYDIVVKMLAFILRVVNFALEVTRMFTDARGLAVIVTGSDKIVDVPTDPKPLPPAAQRALREAEERERIREIAHANGGQAASGTSQAS